MQLSISVIHEFNFHIITIQYYIFLEFLLFKLIFSTAHIPGLMWMRNEHRWSLQSVKYWFRLSNATCSRFRRIQYYSGVDDLVLSFYMRFLWVEVSKCSLLQLLQSSKVDVTEFGSRCFSSRVFKNKLVLSADRIKRFDSKHGRLNLVSKCRTHMGQFQCFQNFNSRTTNNLVLHFLPQFH